MKIVKTYINTMKKFEYFTFDFPLDIPDLNRLGAKGWELVSHTAVAGPGGACQYYVFKRQLNKPSEIPFC